MIHQFYPKPVSERDKKMKREPFPPASYEEQINPATSLARRDLFVSLCVLAIILILALGRTAQQSNYLKCVRILVAFCTYGAVLLTLLRCFDPQSVRVTSFSFWPFAVAAATAELASGWLRPNWRASDILLAPLAAFLVGGIHWLSLRAWRQLRERIETSREMLGDVAPPDKSS